MAKDNFFDVGTPADLINFQIERNIANLFKGFLITLEDIRDGEPVNYEKQRKRILDAGNLAIREIESQLALFDISFKQR